MTFEEFVKQIANRIDNRIRFDGIPDKFKGHFCQTCFDKEQELTAAHFDRQNKTWDCDVGHRVTTLK